MLSEFEIAKPNRNFSQLHLEYYEMLLMSVQASLILDPYKYDLLFWHLFLPFQPPVQRPNLESRAGST
jgi:hypothetical protein